ncbi:hypothetical protein [Actinokineospora pegani]|uniref:hypothetical protein n=1 Tax=Actinokineospora pegani TaxID=2654637 RepID=UPI0012EAD31C|nr:hypothetical protein [Actinokineospora pegani]
MSTSISRLRTPITTAVAGLIVMATAAATQRSDTLDGKWHAQVTVEVNGVSTNATFRGQATVEYSQTNTTDYNVPLTRFTGHGHSGS